MKAIYKDLAGESVVRCDICHEPLSGVVMTTEEVATPAPDGAGVVSTLTIIHYLTLPCAHHGRPYCTADGGVLTEIQLAKARS